jgi:SNF2 family DNA or RNA helicase
LVEDHKLLVIFDEMPTKYANRGTALYKATAEVLYTTFVIPQDGKGKGKPLFYPSVKGDRPSEVFYVAMSATPISNSPEDFFNSIRLMDSSIYGSVKDFNNQFVSSRDRWFQIDGWKSLDLMGAMAAHIVHQVDKHTDPEINAQFPTKLPPETVYCDMDSATEKLYAKLQKEYENIKNGSMLDFEEILAAIGTFQMLCSNPRSVLISAKIREEYEAKLDDFLATDPSEDEIKEFEKKFRDGSLVALKLRTLVNDDSKFTDENAKGECIVSKMIELRERIEQNDDKVIVFSTMNQTLLPLISEWLDKWGITHVSYHGGITGHANKQAIIDEFRTNPDVKVFLSTDAGSDSIDLPEATLTIHYDLPWTKSKITQRENRQDRIDSTKDAVQVVTLAVPFTVEDRKAEILSIKQGYHDSLFNGVISETEGKAVKSDFFYILTGKREGE